MARFLREKKEAARSKEQREKREKDEDGKPRTPGQRNVTSSASPPSRHHTREYALPPSRSLPGQQRVSDGNELRDLAVGTLVVALTIFALFWAVLASTKFSQHRDPAEKGSRLVLQ